MEPVHPQWDRLARFVEASRSSRGLSRKAVANNGGPSDTTLSKIEVGEWRPGRGVDQTLDKLDAGLGWEPGSASRILGGGEPSVAGAEQHTTTTLQGPLSEVPTSTLADIIKEGMAELHRRLNGPTERGTDPNGPAL